MFHIKRSSYVEAGEENRKLKKMGSLNSNFFSHPRPFYPNVLSMTIVVCKQWYHHYPENIKPLNHSLMNSLVSLLSGFYRRLWRWKQLGGLIPVLWLRVSSLHWYFSCFLCHFCFTGGIFRIYLLFPLTSSIFSEKIIEQGMNKGN